MLIPHERSGPRSVSDCSEFVLQILSQRPDAKEDNLEVFFSPFFPRISLRPAQLVLNTCLLMLALEDPGQEAKSSFHVFLIFSTRNGLGEDITARNWVGVDTSARNGAEVDITARNGVGVDITSKEWGWILQQGWGSGGYHSKKWGRGGYHRKEGGRGGCHEQGRG